MPVLGWFGFPPRKERQEQGPPSVGGVPSPTEPDQRAGSDRSHQQAGDKAACTIGPRSIQELGLPTSAPNPSRRAVWMQHRPTCSTTREGAHGPGLGLNGDPSLAGSKWVGGCPDEAS